MRVIIKQEHCLNTYFLDCDDCALNRAVKEQHPNFNIYSVGGDYIKQQGDYPRKMFKFNATFETGWNSLRFYELKNGKIKEYILDIPVPEYDNLPQQIPEKDIDLGKTETPKPKETIRYVSVIVPETILKEQKEETIFN